MNNDDVVKLFNKQKDVSKRGLSVQYENTDVARAFYNADTSNYWDNIQFNDTLGRKRRAMVHFQKVQAPVDAVAGFMAQNRRQAKYVARINSSEEQGKYSKNMNYLSAFHRENMNADQVETEQDLDMLICGYGAVETDLSYIVGNATRDPNGEILELKLDPKKWYWDPNCVNKNLIGASWKGYFEDFELKQAISLFQDSSEEDFEKSPDTDVTGDTGYVYNPWGGLYDKIKQLDNVEWTAKEQDMVRVYNHQWMQYETFYRAKNPLYQTDSIEDALFYKMRLDIIASEIKDQGPDDIKVQDMFEFDPTAEELVFDQATKGKLVKEFGDLIDPVGFVREAYYTAVISGKHVFKWFRNVSQQGFSIKCKTGTYNHTGKYWVGMVNAMMEPQRYSDKALTELMFTIASNSKGGVMVEEDAVEDISDFEAKYAKTDAVIKVLPGAISGGKIQDKTKPAMPTGFENIISLADVNIENVGVSQAFLGDSNDKDETGILQKRRIRQVISKFARYFDSITLFQKEHARLMCDLIRVWVQNNNGADINIVGEDGRDGLLIISEDMLAPEYSVSIQEAPQTPEDKQQTASILGTYGDKMMMIDPEVAKAFYAESLQNLPLDGDSRNRLLTLLQPNQDMVPMAQVQQLQQVIEQLQGQMAQLEMGKIKSETDYNVAKTQRELATTGKTLEEAARTGLENDLVRSGDYETPTVNI